MQFFVDGHELDVQDPTFFMDEEEYTEIKQTLDEMLSTYADLPMAKPRQRPILSNNSQTKWTY